MAIVTSKDGTTIGYDVRGSGPVLIVVMGATQYRAIDHGSARLADLLRGDNTVILYDRRGRGESGDTRPYAVAREIEDIAALIAAAVAPGGRASLFGMSSGAMLAIEAAAALPDRIERIVAYEPPVQIGRPATAIWAELDEMERLAASGDGALCQRTFMESIGMPRAGVDAFAASPAWAGFAAVGTTIAHDFRIMAEAFADGPPARFGDVQTPVLVVDGDQSFPFMASGADAVAAALNTAARKTLAGQDHGPKPEIIAPIIRDFLTSGA